MGTLPKWRLVEGVQDQGTLRVLYPHNTADLGTVKDAGSEAGFIMSVAKFEESV
jgi:hypothetical protein